MQVYKAQRTASAILAENVARSLWTQLRDLMDSNAEMAYSYAWTQVDVQWFDSHSGSRVYILKISTAVSKEPVTISVTMSRHDEQWKADSASWEEGGSGVHYECIGDSYGHYILNATG